MSWDTALDRLVLQQIHLAEKGSVRSEELRGVLLDLRRIAPERVETAYLLGYARALLGLDLPEPVGASASRWHTFGRLRGHDRRGERSWVADLLNEPESTLQLLLEPRIAPQVLPLVLRTLFWSGNLDFALRALTFVTGKADPETQTVVDAALADLLQRLESQLDRPGDPATTTIVERVLQLPNFPRLPEDLRARYHTALSRAYLRDSRFEEALGQLAIAKELTLPASRARGQALYLGMLAELRLHEGDELLPRKERPERMTALRWVADVGSEQAAVMPMASFVQGILLYESGDYRGAEQAFQMVHHGSLRGSGRDAELIGRTNFFLACAILAGGNRNESARALRLLDESLESCKPDLETFYPVHEALKSLDKRLALRFLDAVDVGRGTSADQLLIVALEYLSLGEAEPAFQAAQRVLQLSVDLDQRIEAMRTQLTARNMTGDRDGARQLFAEIRDLLMQRGAFTELENLLKNEAFVGLALDHLEIKCEMVALYEEMEGREYEKANLQLAIARSLRARKDPEALREARLLLAEAQLRLGDAVREEQDAVARLLQEHDEVPAEKADVGARAQQALGRRPRVLVVGGNERQRRHHARFVALCEEWGLDGDWVMANYTSPQKTVASVQSRIERGLDLLVLLHWNRHEATEPAFELARKQGILARTVHYAGFTSLQVGLQDLLEKLTVHAGTAAPAVAGSGRGKGRG
jgi:hypothetical protein